MISNTTPMPIGALTAPLTMSKREPKLLGGVDTIGDGAS
jgi:hypothetical protein